MEKKEKFIKLLESTKRPGIDKLIEYLKNETDFFTAPASTKYHLAKEKGLLEHSLNVYDALIDEIKEDSNENISESCIIVSLLHDICKANYYKKDYRNVKVNGVWQQVECYTVDDQLPLGHGEKSVMIIQEYIQLTREEIIAIRWHMGGFENKDNYQYLSNAFSKCSLALKLHIADLKATYLIENQN